MRKTVPTEAAFMSMRRAYALELELNEKEVQQLRSRLYAINKDGIRRFRTFRDGNILVVWRFK